MVDEVEEVRCRDVPSPRDVNTEYTTLRYMTKEATARNNKFITVACETEYLHRAQHSEREFDSDTKSQKTTEGQAIYPLLLPRDYVK